MSDPALQIPDLQPLADVWVATFPKGQVIPRRFDPATGTFHVEAQSLAWMTNVRLIGAKLAERCNSALPHPIIKRLSVSLLRPRVFVTGSRLWPAPQVVADTLLDTWHDVCEDGLIGFVLIHGDASGVDTIAADWAAANGITAEAYPADWQGPCTEQCPPNHRKPRGNRDYCPLAGHRRNQLMTDLGADLCLAFQHNNSSGTADAMRRSAAAGIPVRRITA